jgi:hypothetical protein
VSGKFPEIYFLYLLELISIKKQKHNTPVRFEVLTAEVIMTNIVFWDVMFYALVEVY